VIDAAQKAAILVEALPYIRRFAGATVVVKYGGSTMGDPELADHFAADVVLMHHLGMRVVVVHGGGPQVSAAMRDRGKEPVFVDGRRTTDAETMEIVREVLAETVNAEIVETINAHGAYAAGLSGEEGMTLQSSPRDPATGFLGTIDTVDPARINALLEASRIPVIAPIGIDDAGQTYNNNADSAASAIAVALNARKLVLLTDVPGLSRDLGDPDALISEVSVNQLRDLIADGTVHGGMIPKCECAIEAVDGGVERVHLLDGRTPHVLLLEFFTDAGIGTMVTA
jgi:acetylglutamate kinase